MGDGENRVEKDEAGTEKKQSMHGMVQNRFDRKYLLRVFCQCYKTIRKSKICV
jgi:hypothetical protein